ncbi:response regulator transcription factor [Streptomyces sp. NBC_00038]|uniref:response regulator transcription factor n=1 Tax=Streptomyces sp. NBC_00038 TaxID=2903615 RepID=UPI00224D67E9|nr:response regulator [Streptomyces sp. NBC_00038]MCX5558749.1 response regulator [Streptomyces sp. NBC_00038]
MTGPTAVSRGTHGAPGAPSAKVLVVDDEHAVRELLAETFRLAGFDVTAVASGVAALNTAYAEPPDLVVLDIRLPDFDSLEVARILRDDGRDVPVVFLPKPFVLENIVTRVRQILTV